MNRPDPSTDPSPDPPRDPARVRVLLPVSLDEAYDYAVPVGMCLGEGDYVRVPLGPRKAIGVVWNAAPGEARVEASKLKPVIEKFDLPPLGGEGRKLIDWTAGYTVSRPGDVLRLTLNVPAVFDPPKPRLAYVRTGEPPERMTEERRRVLEAAGDGPPRTVRDLAREAAVSDGVIRGLIEAGTLGPVELADLPPLERPEPKGEGPVLSPDQAAAAQTIRARIGDGDFAPVLIDGVTGSGKTEVYFDAIAATLDREPDAQILVLLPEIALTSQWLERFEARFGAQPVEWHSDLTGAQRRQRWLAVAKGEAQVIVGARSALFLPFANLRLIVIDEEHDPAFKQEDGVIYNARDMAVVRASLGRFPLILASATPSLETIHNCESGRYERLHLPQRIGGAQMPAITLVDMRATPPERGRWLAPALAGQVEKTLEAGEQALLFLNRRGYAPLTLCRTCGHHFECPNCSAWLVEHRYQNRLLCHHCDYAIALPKECPECGTEESLAACGPGVERIEEEVVARFPQARILTLTSDTMTGPYKNAALIRQISEHAVDLVIGTQIVAKGHHFPLLTLVGVIDADLGLKGGDLRAAERTWQQLSQVAGRAGREQRPGRVLIQTYMPEHPLMGALAAGDREAFVATEMEERRSYHLPPFGRLAALIVSGADQERVFRAAKELAKAAPARDDVLVLGPAPAPMALLRGRYRYRLLLKAKKQVNVPAVVRDWLRHARLLKKVRIQVDVDPYSFF